MRRGTLSETWVPGPVELRFQVGRQSASDVPQAKALAVEWERVLREAAGWREQGEQAQGAA